MKKYLLSKLMPFFRRRFEAEFNKIIEQALEKQADMLKDCAAQCKSEGLALMIVLEGNSLPMGFKAYGVKEGTTPSLALVKQDTDYEQ